MQRSSAARNLAFLLVLGSGLLGGCATSLHRPAPGPKAIVTLEQADTDPNSWSGIITAADAQRLMHADAAWATGLKEAQPHHAADIAREGPLLDPAGGLPRPTPPPGTYRCRVVALGSGALHRGRAFQQFKPFTCFVVVEDKLLVFMKATGTQLPGGRLWEDGDKRLVFLGAMADKPGAAAPAYGTDPRRDRAGIVERVGDFRWRMVTPWVDHGPTVEVMELVPDTPPAPPPAATTP